MHHLKIKINDRKNTKTNQRNQIIGHKKTIYNFFLYSSVSDSRIIKILFKNYFKDDVI